MSLSEPGTARAPSPSTPLIGRSAEVAAVRSLLDGQRLVTVVGAGGTGKTRLALEVAHGRPDARFVDLSPLSSPDLVLPAVARALGLREAGAVPVVRTLHWHLTDRTELLVLDNVEHVLAAATDLADLLDGCPHVRVLATSRSPLRLPGEHLVMLRPLPRPSVWDTAERARLLEVPSVALVVARLRAAVPDLDHTDEVLALVAELCRVLDGLPLALELAAAQVRVLGLSEVIARSRQGLAGEGFPVRRGAPERHRSLDAAITWSVGRLADPEKRLFRRLSVFAGSFTAQAAQEVCGDRGRDVRTALASLVEHSLVDAFHTGGAVRYRMLDTLRRYAAGPALAEVDGEDDLDVGARLLTWCRSVAAAVSAVPVADEARWFDVAEAELDNLRVALDYCPPRRTALALEVAADLYFFWDIRGYLGEGVRHLRHLLVREESHDAPAVRERALQSLGLLLLWQDDLDGADAALREAAEAAERRGDLGGWAWCVGSLAIAHFVSGNITAVADLAERGLEAARRVGAWMPLLRTTCGLGLVRWAQGRRAEARTLLHENARLAEPSRWGVGKASWFLGWFAFVEGDLDGAELLFRSGASTFEQVGDRRSLPDCQDGLACVLAERGAAREALDLLASAERLRARAGSRRSTYLHVRCERAREVAQSRTAPPCGITRREHQVAVLIAAGMTNRQIARRLGISERTAERHVENLRVKLDVRARTQIAAWVATLPRTGPTALADTTHIPARPSPVEWGPVRSPAALRSGRSHHDHQQHDRPP